jgi:hypothetical protein
MRGKQAELMRNALQEAKVLVCLLVLVARFLPFHGFNRLGFSGGA